MVWKLTTFQRVTFGVPVKYCPFRLGGRQARGVGSLPQEAADVPRAGQAPLKTAGEKSVPGFTPTHTRLTIKVPPNWPTAKLCA